VHYGGAPRPCEDADRVGGVVFANGADMSSKVLVIGLDGATFDLVGPWVAAGKLPSLGGLMADGVWGTLKSVVPSISAPAWVSFMTGKNPGKHGVLDFVTRSTSGDGRPRLVSSLSFPDKTLWEVLGSHGRTVGVVNVPVTYPPKKVNGFLISCFMTPPSAKVFTYPEELARAIPDYRIDTRFALARHQDGRGYESKRELLREQYDITRKRASVVLRLLDAWPVDFFMVVFKGTDNMQHYFWDRRDILLDYYRTLDDIVGEIVARGGSAADVFIISDHGFGPRGSKEFYTNAWLEGLGLLRTRRSVGSRLRQSAQRLALNVNRKMELGRRLPAAVSGVASLVVNHETKVVWGDTTAYGRDDITSIVAVNINLRGREPYGVVEPGRDYEAVRDTVVEKLRAVADPDSGARVMRDVFRREEIYSGRNLGSMPDVIGVPHPEYVVKNKMSFSRSVFLESTELMSGEHYAQPDGMFIAHGPDIRKGVQIQGARLIDIAPTVLHVMGVPVPGDMDGVVLSHIFAEGSEPFARQPVYQDTEEEKARVRERIERVRGLGGAKGLAG